MLYLITELMAQDLRVPTLGDSYKDRVAFLDNEKVRFRVVDDFVKLKPVLDYFKLNYKMVVNHDKYNDPDGALLVDKDHLIPYKILCEEQRIVNQSEESLRKAMDEVINEAEDEELI